MSSSTQSDEISISLSRTSAAVRSFHALQEFFPLKINMIILTHAHIYRPNSLLKITVAWSLMPPPDGYETSVPCAETADVLSLYELEIKMSDGVIFLMLGILINK